MGRGGAQKWTHKYYDPYYKDSKGSPNFWNHPYSQPIIAAFGCDWGLGPALRAAAPDCLANRDKPNMPAKSSSKRPLKHKDLTLWFQGR